MKGRERVELRAGPKKEPSRLMPPTRRESESMTDAEEAPPRECPNIPTLWRERGWVRDGRKVFALRGLDRWFRMKEMSATRVEMASKTSASVSMFEPRIVELSGKTTMSAS